MADEITQVEEPRKITADDITFPDDTHTEVSNPYEPDVPSEVEEDITAEQEPSQEEPVVEIPETPEPESPTSTDEDYYKAISEETSLELSSDDDIVANLKLVKQLKQENEALKNFSDYDPLVKDIAAATKAGLDIPTYLSARTLNVEGLDGKRAMLEKFKLDNSDSVKRNPDLALKKFERDFAAKYNDLDKVLDPDEFDDDNEYQKALENQEFLKMDFEDAVAVAKQGLGKWQQENVTIPEAQDPDEEAAAERVTAYNNEVENTIGTIKGLKVPVGENEFVFDLGKEGLESVKNGLLNPEQALKDVFGVDLSTGKVDTKLLAKALAFNASFNNKGFGDAIKNFTIESHNRETLAAREANPAVANATPGSADLRSEAQKVADAFASKREANIFNPYK